MSWFTWLFSLPFWVRYLLAAVILLVGFISCGYLYLVADAVRDTWTRLMTQAERDAFLRETFGVVRRKQR